VIRYVFGPEDLGRVRFAISPMFELAASVEVLRDPDAHGIHAPWVRAARKRLGGLDIGLLDALVPGRGYRPDFVTPPPETPRPGLEDGLARVRATPGNQIRKEVAWAFPGGRMPVATQELIAGPDAGLERLTAQMAAYWDRAIAPWWERIVAALEADVAHHARGLAAGGPLAAFADLHPRVSWRAGAVEVEHPYDAEVELAGRGLLLVPAAFVWPGLWAMLDPPWQPAIVYAPRGLGTLWEPPRRVRTGALDGLLGRRRARILAELGTPASTSELATRLHASAAGVSEHLATLRRAGLVSAAREGRAMLYVRTEAGDVLVRAASADHA
jgi:DNA-binding transcriptional ArsR family regulator